MNFTEKDIKEIKEAYLTFLHNLKMFLQVHHFDNIEKQFRVVQYLLVNGYFSENNPIIFDDQYQFLSLSTELGEAVQVMNGICCCRHANGLLIDLLRQLDYLCEELYIWIDEYGDWHKRKNVLGSNHVVTSVKYEEIELIIDLFNNFIFMIDSLGNTIPLTKEQLTIGDEMACKTYNDQMNIKKISKVLKKYYTLRDLGITHVYEEEIYGM